MIGNSRERSRRFHARRGLHDLLPLIRPRQQVPKFLPNIDHLLTSQSSPRSFRHNRLKLEKLLHRSRGLHPRSAYICGDSLGHSYCNAKDGRYIKANSTRETTKEMKCHVRIEICEATGEDND